MVEKKLIIYTSSYLISKGFSVILRDLNFKITQKKINSENELFEAFADENYDFFVTDTKILEKLQKKEKISNLERLKIIIIGNENGGFSTDLNIVKRISKSSKKHEIHSNLLEVFEEKTEFDTSNDISEREREIVKYVALGFTNKEIAEKLFLSIHTVTTHRKNITNKLDIKTISGLTIYAILNGIISIDET